MRTEDNRLSPLLVANGRKDKTFPGIYKFDGDTLTACFSEPGKEPPTEFKSEAGGG